MPADISCTSAANHTWLIGSCRVCSTCRRSTAFLVRECRQLRVRGQVPAERNRASKAKYLMNQQVDDGRGLPVRFSGPRVSTEYARHLRRIHDPGGASERLRRHPEL